MKRRRKRPIWAYVLVALAVGLAIGGGSIYFVNVMDAPEPGDGFTDRIGGTLGQDVGVGEPPGEPLPADYYELGIRDGEAARCAMDGDWLIPPESVLEANRRLYQAATRGLSAHDRARYHAGYTTGKAPLRLNEC